MGAPPAQPSGPYGPISAVVLKARAEQDILAQIDLLPSLPTVVFEVMRIANDPKSSAGDFQDTLRHDQALAARVLKLSNSSFFARQRRITTLSESVVILGLKTLKSIVTAASVSKTLGRKMAGYGYGDVGLWKHSFATALSSRTLATALKLGVQEAEEAFVAGLLHDIGKLALDPIVRARANALREEVVVKRRPRIEAERQVIGFDHSEIGVKLARKWNLPDHIQEAIWAHHALENAREHGKIAAIVALADNLMNAAGIGLLEGKGLDEPLPSKALDALSVGSGDVASMRGKVEAQLEEIRTLCEKLGPS